VKKVTPETNLKKAAKDLLALYRIWTFPVTAGLGSYPGIPDRLGIFKGLPLAIEFKAGRGKLTPHQANFKERWEKEGGVYILCRGIEDLAAGLGIKMLGIV
jgi:hypothetical protein